LKLCGSSFSKSGPGFDAAPDISGFISLQAGRDAICSWRSGKDLNACHSLRPVNLHSPQYNRLRSKQSQLTDGAEFSKKYAASTTNRNIRCRACMNFSI
jgi:hypothetical protein